MAHGLLRRSHRGHSALQAPAMTQQQQQHVQVWYMRQHKCLSCATQYQHSDAIHSIRCINLWCQATPAHLLHPTCPSVNRLLLMWPVSRTASRALLPVSRSRSLPARSTSTSLPTLQQHAHNHSAVSVLQ